MHYFFNNVALEVLTIFHKMYNSSQPNSRSFNNSELSNGFHLLTESSHNVTINTPTVPAHNAHLYPRLAGSNWTSYLSQPSVILGRSGTAASSRATRQKQTPQPKVGVDFGNAMAISRKHCEVRFSFRRDRWELYVYGRNGVRVNHILKKPKDRPVVLTTGSLIEINNTTFVFILPNKYIKPTASNTTAVEEVTEADKCSDNVEKTDVNPDLENAVISIFKDHYCLNTADILRKLKNTFTQPIEKESILHLLVLSSQFQLAPNSISMSSKDSDNVKWMLSSSSKENGDTQDSAKTPVRLGRSSSDMSIVASSPALNTRRRSKRQLSRMDSVDDMSITSTAAVEGSDAPFSIRSTSFSNDDDMSITAPNTAINTPVFSNNKSRLSRLESTDDMSISSVNMAGDPNLSFSISFRDGIMFRTPSSLDAILPPLQENRNARILTPSASFARFLDGDTDWSVSSPEIQKTNEKSQNQIDSQPVDDVNSSAEVPRSLLFNSMSIESMYSVWSSSAINEDDDATPNSDSRPRKKTKSSRRQGDNAVSDQNERSNSKSQDKDSLPEISKIYHGVRTKLLY